MANILIVVDNELNGDGRVLREIDILLGEGHTIECLCYDFGNARCNERKDIHIRRIQISKAKRDKLLPMVHTFPLFDSLWRKEVHKAIQEFSPYYIVAMDLYMAKPVRRAIEGSKSYSKLILDLHENYPVAIQTYGWNKGLKRILARSSSWIKKEEKYLKFADHIIVIHENFKKHLQKVYINLPPISVFPNVLNIEKYDGFQPQSVQLSFKHKDAPCMFYFGNVAKRRGIFDCFEILEGLIDLGEKVNFLIIGPIDNADNKLFTYWLAKPKLQEYVEYIPWINIEQLPSYMKEVDFCVAPFEVNEQHNSGVANKIYQYMYGAKPIVASNCVPQADLIEKAKCGLIYNDKTEFVNSIRHIKAQPKEAAKMGEWGRSYLLKNLQLDQVKKEFVQIFNE